MIQQVMITVGTYTFDALLEKMDSPEMIEVFKKHGYNRIVYQCGRSSYAVVNAQKLIDCEVFGLTPKYEEYVANSKLIIGHCGAGTILDAIKKKVSAIIVSNETMMHNHQRELLDALVEENAIIGFEESSKVTPQSIDEAIQKINRKVVEPLKIPSGVNIFKTILDSNTYL